MQRCCKLCQKGYRELNRETIQARQREQYDTKARATGRKKWHRLSHTPEHHVWRLILWRCYNKNCEQYENYGGRGITVCDRWRNDFMNFWNDMGPRPGPGWTIERRNTNGNYEPDNCFWATQKEQQNNRRNNRLITFDGRTQTLSMWSDETGINRSVITRRLDYLGWPVEKTLTTATRQCKPRCPDGCDALVAE